MSATIDGADDLSMLEVRLSAIDQVARFHHMELDRELLRVPPGERPTPATLVRWVRDGGLWAKAAKLTWGQLLKVETASPIVLLLDDGGAAILATSDTARNVVWLRDPSAPSGELPVAVDELRLSQVWSGEALLIRSERGQTDDTAPFTVGWLAKMVLLERRTLRDIIIASVVLSVLAILPPLVVMTVIDKVLTHHSPSTLIMIGGFIALMLIYDTIIGHARREMIAVVGARVDAKLSLHVFKRLLGLPLDFFEREQAGVITHHLLQVNKVRDFLTGKMVQVLLDLITLIVLVPVLFLLQATLTWMTLICGGVIAVVIMVFLSPISRAVALYIDAETAKSSVLIESIHGIRTVKSLALEPQQRELWDKRTALSTQRKLNSMRISNWPQTIITPIEGFMSRGVLLIGVGIALGSPDSVDTGALIAFMMLSGRVAQPLAGLAKIMEDFQEVRVSVGLAAGVLNNAPESANPGAGMRPQIAGAVSFNKVSYSYPNTKAKALDGITFDIPAGTMLGLVGRSGSGKSTVTRLLQGITRDYDGFLKLDATDLREINIGHMRRSFGVVLQENFLFRGTIRENILAGRPGLTLSDAVRACRLAGAEEFIERMPNGYETWIEEGSPNLSGGQRQRLAIARALIHDPKLLILDEATSALDADSEAMVQQALTELVKGRTTFIIAHRFSTIAIADRILVFQAGRIVADGSHEQLRTSSPIYQSMLGSSFVLNTDTALHQT